MGSFKVNVLTGPWQQAMFALLARLPGVPRTAGHAAAEEVENEAIGLLMEFEHAPGTYTASPSGSPPGTISGGLAGSFVITDTSEGAMVGPTADQAREQELGGPMKGHPLMKWENVGGKWQRRLVVLPPRPYLKPATENVVGSGEVTRIYYDALNRVILSVTG